MYWWGSWWNRLHQRCWEGGSDGVLKKRNTMKTLIFTNVSQEHNASTFRADNCDLIDATFKIKIIMMMSRSKITNLTNTPRNRLWHILQKCLWKEWTKTILEFSQDLIEEPADELYLWGTKLIYKLFKTLFHTLKKIIYLHYKGQLISPLYEINNCYSENRTISWTNCRQNAKFWCNSVITVGKFSYQCLLMVKQPIWYNLQVVINMSRIQTRNQEMTLSHVTRSGSS